MHVFFGYILRNEIAGLYGSSIFIFLRKLHIVFYNDCTNLHSHQPCKTVPLSPYPLQCLWLVFFLITANMTGGRGDISLWFWPAFLWWSVLLSIFSCAYWPSVCLPLPFFLLWLHPWHAEIPRPGSEPTPQQWQCWIFNPLSHQRTPCVSSLEKCLFKSSA